MKPIKLSIDYIEYIVDNVYSIIFFIVVMLLIIVATRAIFSIPAILRYQKAQVLLLIKMAEKGGVSDVSIQKIIDTVESENKIGTIDEDKTIRYIHKNF